MQRGGPGEVLILLAIPAFAGMTAAVLAFILEYLLGPLVTSPCGVRR